MGRRIINQLPEQKTTGSVQQQRIIFHLALPLLAPAAIVCLYFTPKAVFGCANRGLMALAVMFLAMIAAMVTAGKGIKAKKQGDQEASNWWILTTIILLFPLVLVFGPLG
jgi:hypothetical protein